MKNLTIITTILIFLAAINANAKIILLNNNNPSPGQYTTYAAAETAAVSGDTIYVSGSATSYGNINVNKDNITIIGTGYNPDKQNPLVSTFGVITTDDYFSGNLILKGILCNSLSLPHNAVEIYNCKINGDILFSNHLTNRIYIYNSIIIGSLIDYYNSSGECLIVIRNSIFGGIISTISDIQLNLQNNIFYGTGFLISTNMIIISSLIENNIFYGRSLVGSVSNQTSNTIVISHNCAYPSTNTFLWSIGIPDGGNNIVADPQFINPGQLLSGTFSFNDDYSVAVGSPCHNTGSDGTDRGVFGGAGGFSMSGEPPIPQIKTMTVPASVQSGQPLNINFTSQAKQ